MEKGERAWQKMWTHCVKNKTEIQNMCTFTQCEFSFFFYLPVPHVCCRVRMKNSANIFDMLQNFFMRRQKKVAHILHNLSHTPYTYDFVNLLFKKRHISILFLLLFLFS